MQPGVLRRLRSLSAGPREAWRLQVCSKSPCHAPSHPATRQPPSPCTGFHHRRLMDAELHVLEPLQVRRAREWGREGRRGRGLGEGVLEWHVPSDAVCAHWYCVLTPTLARQIQARPQHRIRLTIIPEALAVVVSQCLPSVYKSGGRSPFRITLSVAACGMRACCVCKKYHAGATRDCHV